MDSIETMEFISHMLKKHETDLTPEVGPIKPSVLHHRFLHDTTVQTHSHAPGEFTLEEEKH